MGNYHNLESEFIERTMSLISQYYKIVDQYPFVEQFNYTLTINCLLGLIVLPKERAVTFIPNSKLTNHFRKEIGLELSEIGAGIITLRDLINGLRNSVAHFDITVISDEDKNLIDWIEFKDTKNGSNIIAKFRAGELLPFLTYYSNCLLRNLEKHQDHH
jgi:HEPN pEK499 p136